MQNNFFLFFIINYCEKIDFTFYKKKQYRVEIFLDFDKYLIKKIKSFYNNFLTNDFWNLINLKYEINSEIQFNISSHNPKYIVKKVYKYNKTMNKLNESYESYEKEWKKYAIKDDFLENKQIDYKPDYKRYKKYKYAIDKKRTIMLSKILHYKIKGKIWWIIAIISFLISLCLILSIVLH